MQTALEVAVNAAIVPERIELVSAPESLVYHLQCSVSPVPERAMSPVSGPAGAGTVGVDIVEVMINGHLRFLS
ncbi:hypothetical protein [Mycobacterium sp.]|uniref:hypothetical protein n=1 Tax=Mycobacterium sp. TaxID=1785 RepID=UPI003D6A87A5